MSEQDNSGPTSATPQHAWLKNLVGEWKTETEMSAGSEAPLSAGHETFTMLGDLWVIGDGEITFPEGDKMLSRMGLGFDVSAQQYKAFWVVSVSSHMWKYDGELSEDGKTMTLNCEGPDIMGDAPSAFYRDIIQLIDEDHRTHTSTMQAKDGTWVQYMKNYYTRVK